MRTFKAKIDIIGVNPFVYLPQAILESIFLAAGKERGPVPVKGTIDGHPFIQTLVKYSGSWRLYINGPMLKASQKQVGKTVTIALDFDPVERSVPLHPQLAKALSGNREARKVFEKLPPSRQKEIARYIANLKSEEAITRNIQRAIRFLNGQERFVGRDRP